MGELTLDTNNTAQLCYKLQGRIVHTGDVIEMWQPGSGVWKRVVFKWSGDLNDIVELSDGMLSVSFGPTGTFRWPQ